MANNESFKDQSSVIHLVLAVLAFVGIALLMPVLQLIKLFTG
ncbi:hypothetical protein [Aliidiomarina sp.]